MCSWGMSGPQRTTPHKHRTPPDLHVLLLEDLLVLLQKQDEKLLLKCHSKTAVGSSDSKQTFSPVLKLNAVLIRSVATGTREETVPAGPHPGAVSPVTRVQRALGGARPIWGCTELISPPVFLSSQP